MTQSRYEIFDIVSRKPFRAALRRWLAQEPRYVERVLGESHRIYVRWHPCAAPERTNGIAVLKFRADINGSQRLLKRLNGMRNMTVSADGRNSYFLFIFYRRS